MTSISSATPEVTERVTQNESERGWSGWTIPPPEVSPDQIKDARWLPLSAVAASAGATALVAQLALLVARHESSSGTRQTTRRQAGLTKQRQAVGAIVGGLLRRWAREEPQPAYRSRTPADFTGGPIGARQYLAACDALVSLGLVHQSRSIRYGSGIIWEEGGPEFFYGKAPRLWPSKALLEAAIANGVTPATLPDDFDDAYPTQPPAVPEPVQVFTLKAPGKGDKAPIAIRRGDSEGRGLVEEVTSYNAWIAEHDVGGCLPPRLKRVFTVSWQLHGRWYAVGAEGNYQRLPESKRLAQITIDGEPVAEVDVHSSHLSIMHGLLGRPLPQDDLYGFPDVPRAVAKAWITATLGKGSPVTKWAAKARKDQPDLALHDPKQIGRTICGRYPFLRNPAEAVAEAAGLNRLAHIGPPARLLTHRLMAIEAKALTAAMGALRARGVLALPMHDGLIVPRSSAGMAEGYLVGTYSWAANRVRIRCSREMATEVPCG